MKIKKTKGTIIFVDHWSIKFFGCSNSFEFLFLFYFPWHQFYTISKSNWSLFTDTQNIFKKSTIELHLYRLFRKMSLLVYAKYFFAISFFSCFKRIRINLHIFSFFLFISTNINIFVYFETTRNVRSPRLILNRAIIDQSNSLRLQHVFQKLEAAKWSENN